MTSIAKFNRRPNRMPKIVSSPINSRRDQHPGPGSITARGESPGALSNPGRRADFEIPEPYNEDPTMGDAMKRRPAPGNEREAQKDRR
jgi:hypothetical protein